MEVDSELKPLKKKEGDKKAKKQGDKKTEAKPKPPKTIDGALEIVSYINIKKYVQTVQPYCKLSFLRVHKWKSIPDQL